MSKPIEQGCRAVIVNSVAGNNGIVVTVGRFIGMVPEYEGVDRWAINKTLDSFNPLSQEIVNDTNHMMESQLKRIDYNGNETTTWESCAWQPNSVVA